MTTPSQSAIDQYRNLYSEALDVDAFLRSTGEAVAARDADWKNAHNAGRDINGPMADFLLVCSAHLDAMSMAGLRRPALAAMLSMLISVDMAKADTVGLGMLFLDLHRRFLTACASLRHESAGDAFAEPHAAAILAMESRLYLDAFERYSGHGTAPAEYAGLALAARAEAAASAPMSTQEALVDMFSRLHALGLGD